MQEDRKIDLQEFISRCAIELQDALKDKKESDLKKYREHSAKPHSKESRKKYEKTEKGRYARSKCNYNHRTNYKKDCEDLPWEERVEIGRFYKNCPKGYEVDHIHPISKGGKHTLSNLQYLTRIENLRKKDKLEYRHEKEIT